MLWVGLSGGIGSGKSTVSARLAELGAVVVDADRVAREVVEPGRPALAEIRRRFGAEVLTADGALDRPALGAVVFADPQARRDLEAITHPRIAERTQELVAGAPPDAVVVHDIPLLVELDRAGDYALTVIVDVPEEVRLRRLVELREMDEGEARRRIAAQADDEQRHRAADVLLDNTASVEELRAAVDRLWRVRLVPFEENLRLGRPAGGGTPGAEEADADTGAGDVHAGATTGAGPGYAARLAARLRHALGEHLVQTGEGDGAPDLGPEGVGDAGPGSAVHLEAVVDDLAALDLPAVRERLARVGLLVVDGGEDPSEPVLAGADPAQGAQVRLRAGRS